MQHDSASPLADVDLEGVCLIKSLYTIQHFAFLTVNTSAASLGIASSLP